MRKYIIKNTADATDWDFDQLVDNNIDGSRKSLDGTKIIARFEGDTPSFLQGETEYTNAEILPIVKGPEWTDPNIG